MRTTLQWGLFVFLFAAPLPFGAVHRPWVLTLQLVAAGLGALALTQLTLKRTTLPRISRPAIWLGISVLALGLLQILPLPNSIVERLVPRTSSIRSSVAPELGLTPQAWSTLSISPAETLDALLRLGAYGFVALAAAIAIRRRSDWTAIAWAFVAAATFQAIYGSIEYLSGHQHIFGYAKQHYLDEATGTLINRNHFAGLLAMAAPLALALTLRSGRSSSEQNWRTRLSQALRGIGSGRILAAAALLAIWGGIFLSFSRAGMAAALLGSIWVVGSSPSRRKVALLLGLALLLPAAYLVLQDVRTPGSRLETLDDDLRSPLGRLPVWQATGRMALDYPVVGMGLGTFESGFPGYRPASLGAKWEHAHNDWLQAASAGGLLLPLLFFSLLVLCFRPAPTTPADHRPRPPSLIVAGVRGAVLAVAAHSLVDFGLRIPALAAWLAVLAGMLWAARPGWGRAKPRSVGQAA